MFIKIIRSVFIALFLPVYLFFKSIIIRKSPEFTSKKSLIKLIVTKTFLLIFTLVIIFPLYIFIYYSWVRLVEFKLNYLPSSIPISGTGSMYPTFPKGQSKTPQQQAKETVSTPGMLPYPNGLLLFGKRYFSYQIQHGDIVVFVNDKTKSITKEVYGEESGYVKRVIALPGDTIEIRGGLVILNGKILDEPYIAQARSTFGGDFLTDCQVLAIPSRKLFVMGDNRKSSSDSRYELGLIDYTDLTYVLPISKQIGILDKNWRDTQHDGEDASKISLNEEEYLKLLNQKRAEANLKPLTINSKLNQSAELRAKNMLKFDDFSIEATKSAYTAQKAMKDASYSNITWGEAPTNGYYDAPELIDNFFEFVGSKKFLLNPNFQEIGLASVEGQINGCPTQVIVQHFGGYIPPNYKKEEIDAWSETLSDLKSVQPGWQSLKDRQDFYLKHQQEVDRINQIIDLRVSRISSIVDKMKSNQWLSNEETQFTYQDLNLYQEQQSLADKLNRQ